MEIQMNIMVTGDSGEASGINTTMKIETLEDMLYVTTIIGSMIKDVQGHNEISEADLATM